MELYFSLILITIFFALVALLVWLRLKTETAQKDIRADTQDHLIEANTFETGHSSIIRVTKDPQKYAKIFVPDKKRD